MTNPRRKDSQPLQPGFLSLQNAARFADVGVKTVKRWIALGLPFYQASPKGKVLIRPSDIEQFLKRRQAPTPDLDGMVKDTLRDLGIE